MLNISVQPEAQAQYLTEAEIYMPKDQNKGELI